MCDKPFSQHLRKCLILPRSRLVRDTHSYSSAGSQFPHCRFLFWHLCPCFFSAKTKKKSLRAAESQRGKNPIHPILREQAETVQGRWWKSELLLLCHASSSSSRNPKSQHVFKPNQPSLPQTFQVFVISLYSWSTESTWYYSGNDRSHKTCRCLKAHLKLLKSKDLWRAGQGATICHFTDINNGGAAKKIKF